jgi:hypothetical protein
VNAPHAHWDVMVEAYGPSSWRGSEYGAQHKLINEGLGDGRREVGAIKIGPAKRLS